MAAAGLPAVCIETRHANAFLKVQVNKTERNDARSIAEVMRVLFRPMHVKTLTSQKRRALLTARERWQEKTMAVETDIRGLLRNFGLKVGTVGSVKFEKRIRELVDGISDGLSLRSAGQSPLYRNGRSLWRCRLADPPAPVTHGAPCRSG